MDFPNSHVRLPAQPMGTTFSPTDAALLAVGLINGITRLYSATGLVATKLRSARSHAESCRAVCFASDGQTLLSASADATILACNVESGTPLARIRHSKAVDRLASVSATQFAAADESGLIQLWDTRQEEAACAVQMHKDYVTALVAEPDARRLLSTSGDGNLGVMDLRTHKNLAGPNGDPDDELLSLAVLKHGRQVVCGRQSGSLSIFRRDAWEDPARSMTDTLIAGHQDELMSPLMVFLSAQAHPPLVKEYQTLAGCPSSMDALVAFDEDTLIAGSQDGLVRLLSIQPDKLIGALPNADELPIEGLALSGKQASGARLLASISHTQQLCLHDLAQLDDPDSEPEAAAEEATPAQAPEAAEASGSDAEGEPRALSPQKKRRRKGKSKNPRPRPSMFQDLL